MNYPTEPGRVGLRARAGGAFTLIELLVVMAIIGIVAGMVVGLAGPANRKRDESKVKAELAHLVNAIEDYRAKIGSYPPDNPTFAATNAAWNPLFYELTGVRIVPGGFDTPLNPGVLSTPANITSYFSVAGFANADPTNPKSFLKSLRGGGTAASSQYIAITNGTLNPAMFLLKVPARHPIDNAINVWRYRAYPTNGHNPKTFDLWAEIDGGSGRTNIIGNWK